jgi:hypothetical protein
MTEAETYQAAQDMLDREAIRELVIRYCDAVWRDDVDTIVGLFAKHGSIDVVNGPLAGQNVCGHEQLSTFYKAGISKMSPRPFGHNHLVELRGDGRAWGRSSVELRHSRDYSWISVVIYNDEYIKVGDAWKFLKRRAEMQYLG